MTKENLVVFFEVISIATKFLLEYYVNINILGVKHFYFWFIDIGFYGYVTFIISKNHCHSIKSLLLSDSIMIYTKRIDFYQQRHSVENQL